MEKLSASNENSKGPEPVPEVFTPIKEEPKVEKTKFDIELSSIDPAKKLNIIKEFKNIFGLGLKEAKDSVEKLPVVLKKAVDKSDAEELKEKLEKLGCVILMK